MSKNEEVKKIEKLTPEQEANLPVVRDRWLEIGLSTESADRQKAEKDIKAAYVVAGLDEPSTILWARSPQEGAILAYLLEKDKVPQYKTLKGGDVYDLVKKFVDSSEYKDSVHDISSQLYNCGHGLHDANWLSFYDAFTGILDCVEDLRPLMNLAENCCWWWGFEDCVVLTEKPNYIMRDEEHRLHHESRMALEYPDGFGIYAWHGVRVPGWIITEPEKITKDIMLKEENQELRRIMMEIYGMDRYLADEDFEVIHKDKRGTLVEYTGFAQDEGEDPVARYVRVIDPSTGRQYALRVPPTMETATEAVAWSFHIESAKDYDPKSEA